MKELTAEWAAKVEPLWEAFRKDFSFLTDFGTSFRYPGESADKQMAQRAAAISKNFRTFSRKSLGLKPDRA